MIGYQKGQNPERPYTKKAKLTEGPMVYMIHINDYVFMLLMYMSTINICKYFNVGSIFYNSKLIITVYCTLCMHNNFCVDLLYMKTTENPIDLVR